MMEMPVLCSECLEWVELNNTRESPYDKQLKCPDCYQKDYNANEIYREAHDIQYDLDNHEEYMKGDRRGWKRGLKELKNKLHEMGYDYDKFSDSY